MCDIVQSTNLRLGGPGCSSMTGAFLENGPYSVDPHGKLVPRKYSWHTNHNIIYIDNPVGTGFSFTDAPDGYATTSNAVAAELLIALQQFFLLFPDLQKNDFFICGESYAGKYTLALGHAIHHSMAMPKINLKGLTIGNGFIEPLYQFLYADYLYQLGLIDANTHRIFVVNEKRQTDCILNGNYEGAHEIFQYLIHSHADSIFFNLSGFDSYYNYLEPQATNHTPMTAFVRTPETRRAIHVGHNVFCNLENVNLPKFNLWSDVMVGYAHYLTELLSHYPVLIYNGQLDIISAYPMTENLLNHLNFDGADQFRRSPRQIWRVNNELAGYIKCGGNLTSALVRNAGKISTGTLWYALHLIRYILIFIGHMVPADKPKWMLDLLLKFTHPKGLV